MSVTVTHIFLLLNFSVKVVTKRSIKGSFGNWKDCKLNEETFTFIIDEKSINIIIYSNTIM